MGHIDSVRDLASLFRANNEARPVVLLGAGTSFSSGIPLAAESVRRLARRVFADKIKGGSLLPEQVKLTEWQTWLRNQPWFIQGEERLAENFPLAVEHLLKPREYRTTVLLDLLQPTAGIGSGYKRLAEFVMRGLVRTMLTTNFDCCIPSALGELRSHILRISEVNRGPDDLREFDLYNRAQIVWLHGKAEQYTDRTVVSETNKLDNRLVSLLSPLLASSPLIVIGYRGAEASVMDHLLIQQAKKNLFYKKGVYWCIRPGEKPHSRVETLRRKIQGNFKYLEIDGFDELFESLAAMLHGEDLYPRNSAIPSRSPTAFDDLPLDDATLDEIDLDLAVTAMRDYCSNLGRAPVTSETLLPLLREQGLVVSSGSVDVPTSGCYLLFAKDAQRRFPHAVVSATVAGKKRTVFRGNLLQQRADLLAWLDDGDVNPVLRIKRRTTHEQKTAYPSRGLVELLVNLLVHRDYEIKEPSSIDVRPGMGITFGNPGTLPEAVARQVQSDSDGRFQPVPKLSELRNRSLCDVFFGIRAMERQGTGLTDVCDLAKEHGGDATFTNDSRNSCFLAQVAQATASSASSFVARDDRHTGVYVLNILPFRLMPEHVSHVTLHAPMRLEQQRERLDGLGTLVHRGAELWSFTPLERLLGRLGEVADGPKSRSCTVEQVLAASDTKTIIPWLLRKHFEWHLRPFKTHGLILEEGKRKGRRAYFTGCDGKPRTLIYDTPSRRGVKRQVVKQRLEGPARWFENEGFGYEIVRLDGSWAIRIKPFYMFTGRDARKPLPAYARTSRATRRMKFDRNKNVEDDLTFWGRFLSAGAATINLGAPHVADLIVDGSFLTIEVPEEGLLDEDKNRMHA